MEQQLGAAQAPDRLQALHTAAREYRERGWAVIPLYGKLPAIATWKIYQTRRPTDYEIDCWLSLPRLPSGLGVVTGKLSRLVIVDCDSPAAAAYWEGNYPASPLTVQTGGGGLHLYYRLDEGSEVRNRAKLFGRQIDLRAEGGYAAAPPSLHESGNQYKWTKKNESLELPLFDPAWVAEKSPPVGSLCNVAGSKVRNAIAYIRRIEAVAGEGGHNATFRAACKLRDAGLSMEEAIVVLSHWNETNAQPRWTEQELLHKVRSAFGRPD